MYSQPLLKMVHDPQRATTLNSRLKTTARSINRSINPLHKFYAVKSSCIHGGRNYKAVGKVRKTLYVLFLCEKKNEVRMSY